MIDKVKTTEKNVKDYISISTDNEFINDFTKSFKYYKIKQNEIIYFNDYSIGGQYFVKNLVGKTITLYLGENNTIYDTKLKIQDIEGIPNHQMRLVYGGMQLEDNRTIKDYSIQEGATFHLLLKLR